MDRPRLRVARPTAQLRQGRADWFKISNKTGDVAKVYLYNEIGGWFGITAKDFVDELNEVTAPKIDLHLNTPGGDVFDGFAIYSALKEHPAEVTSIVDAAALSIGSVIAMAGDTVSIAKVGQMMIHDAFGLTVGTAKDHRDTAKLLDQLSDTIAEVYADRTGGDVADWREAMLAESWYTADEAVKAGLADEVRSGEGKGPEAEDSWDLSVFTYAGRRKAPAPRLRPAAHQPVATGPTATPGPGPAVDVLAGLPAEVWAQLGDALDEVFDPVGGYDPELLRTTILDVYADAPAPPAAPPRPPPERTSITVDELVGAIREGVRP